MINEMSFIIEDSNAEAFYRKLKGKVQEFQNKSYKVEVQYSTCASGSQIVFSALVIGRV